MQRSLMDQRSSSETGMFESAAQRPRARRCSSTFSAIACGSISMRSCNSTAALPKGNPVISIAPSGSRAMQCASQIPSRLASASTEAMPGTFAPVIRKNPTNSFAGTMASRQTATKRACLLEQVPHPSINTCSTPRMAGRPYGIAARRREASCRVWHPRSRKRSDRRPSPSWVVNDRMADTLARNLVTRHVRSGADRHLRVVKEPR
jgi:hypothetical protein